MIKCPIEIGALVYDADPYKAPELWFGLGIVIEIINEDHVLVHWIEGNFNYSINIGFLEVVNEIQDR